MFHNYTLGNFIPLHEFTQPEPITLMKDFAKTVLSPI